VELTREIEFPTVEVYLGECYCSIIIRRSRNDQEKPENRVAGAVRGHPPVFRNLFNFREVLRMDNRRVWRDAPVVV